AADTTNVAEPPPAKLETEASPDVMRAYLQLQEQLHATQLAIESNRQEAEAAATRNTEAVTLRLQALEESLVAQRALELETMRSTNRVMLTVGGVCAAIGFLAMLLTAYLQWRAVSRLTEFSVLSQASLTLGRAPAHSVGAGVADTQPVSSVLTEQVNTRLLGALERLEKRIVELEHTAHPPLGEPNSTAGAIPADGAVAGRTDRVTLLLAKGESLLSLDKTEEALACYDEILALETDHSEALVKKGDTLERLRKIDDAISCYDRAIAAGPSLTVAYLHKGSLFNRLERYEEALQCYEQALRTQEKSQAA
ncbi:MAG: tetratricopeptide repeat protein, partial [Verrucomicrobiota bacterium]